MTCHNITQKQFLGMRSDRNEWNIVRPVIYIYQIVFFKNDSLMK